MQRYAVTKNRSENVNKHIFGLCHMTVYKNLANSWRLWISETSAEMTTISVVSKTTTTTSEVESTTVGKNGFQIIAIYVFNYSLLTEL